MRPGADGGGRNPNWPTHALALADSIPQWVLFKMPTVEPTPPINDALTNAVQRSIHNRLVTWRLPALSPLAAFAIWRNRVKQLERRVSRCGVPVIPAYAILEQT